LNEAEKKLYDTRGVTDGFGPAALRLYSPPVAESMTAVNDYLRRKSGLEPRLVELAILVTAREMDAEYVWTSHEPAARKAGLEQPIIDTVKFRRDASALGEKERVIVQLGRDAIGKHKVDSETFARAVKLFGHQGVVNIASLIGDYAATAILLNVADQHVRDVSLLRSLTSDYAKVIRGLYVMGHGAIVFEGTADDVRRNAAMRKEWLEV
jgi:4-carboxymuconolactone decarboxylase